MDKGNLTGNGTEGVSDIISIIYNKIIRRKSKNVRLMWQDVYKLPRVPTNKCNNNCLGKSRKVF